MFRGKMFLLVALFVVGGVGLIIVGAKNFFNSRRLVAEGRPATATLLARKTWELPKDKKSHQLTVTFETEGRQRITNEIYVAEDIFDRAAAGTIPLYYLPRDPSVCLAGNTVELRYGQFVTGWFFLALGGLLMFLFQKVPNFGDIEAIRETAIETEYRPVASETARKLVKQLAPLCLARHEYAPADPRQFPHLDIGFYDGQRQFLESRGFTFLEDRENLTMRNSGNDPKTFLRLLLGENGTTVACLYHVNPPPTWRMQGAREKKVLDLATQFTNGRFVCTSNAEDAGKLTQSPQVDSLFLPAATPAEVLLAEHQKRVARFVTTTGAQPVPLSSLEDVRKSGNELQRLKAEYRRHTVLTKEELRRLGGAGIGSASDKAVDMIMEEALKESEFQNRLRIMKEQGQNQKKT